MANTTFKLTDADIDRHYSKGALIKNAMHKHMTVVEYRKWLKGEK